MINLEFDFNCPLCNNELTCAYHNDNAYHCDNCGASLIYIKNESNQNYTIDYIRIIKYNILLNFETNTLQVSSSGKQFIMPNFSNLEELIEISNILKLFQ
jgi:hypothetical protein